MTFFPVVASFLLCSVEVNAFSPNVSRNLEGKNIPTGFRKRRRCGTCVKPLNGLSAEARRSSPRGLAGVGGRGGGAGVDVQFLVDVVQVRGHGARSNLQRVRDLLGLVALAHEAKDLFLA